MKHTHVIILSAVGHVLPVVGILFWAWSPWFILVQYWFEALVITFLLDRKMCKTMGAQAARAEMGQIEPILLILIGFCGLPIFILFPYLAAQDYVSLYGGLLEYLPGGLLAIAMVVASHFWHYGEFARMPEAERRVELTREKTVVIFCVASFFFGTIAGFFGVPFRAAHTVAAVVTFLMYTLHSVAFQLDVHARKARRKRRVVIHAEHAPLQVVKATLIDVTFVALAVGSLLTGGVPSNSIRDSLRASYLPLKPTLLSVRRGIDPTLPNVLVDTNEPAQWSFSFRAGPDAEHFEVELFAPGTKQPFVQRLVPVQMRRRSGAWSNGSFEYVQPNVIGDDRLSGWSWRCRWKVRTDYREVWSDWASGSFRVQSASATQSDHRKRRQQLRNAKASRFWALMRDGTIDDIQALLDSDKERVLATEPHPTAGTMLHQLAVGDRVMVAHLLLSNGADINSTRCKGGRTPLHVAARNGQLKMVQFLLEQGANPQAKDARGDTPLDAARTSGSQDVVRVLASESSP